MMKKNERKLKYGKLKDFRWVSGNEEGAENSAAQELNAKVDKHQTTMSRT